MGHPHSMGLRLKTKDHPGLFQGPDGAKPYATPELTPGSAPTGHVGSPTPTYGYQSSQHCRCIYVAPRPRQRFSSHHSSLQKQGALRCRSDKGHGHRWKRRDTPPSHVRTEGRLWVGKRCVNSRLCTGSWCFHPQAGSAPQNHLLTV